MSGVTDIAGRTAPDADPSSEDGAAGPGWARLQIGAAVVTIAAFVFPMIVEREVVGFLLAMAVPFVIGLVLVRFLPRVGAIFLGIMAALTLLASAAYIVPTLGHPESAIDFVPQVFFTLSLLIGAGAAVPAYRELGRGVATSRTPRLTVTAAAGVALLASVVSIASAAQVESVVPAQGDVTLRTADFLFEPVTVTAAAGSISVHVANEDSSRHTFTIDGLVDLNVPPNSMQRVTFQASPGTYRFYCAPHAPGMEGTLVVE